MASCEAEICSTNISSELCTTTLLTLPCEILEKTFSYLGFDEISNGRLVCKSFDKICQQLLNHGFSSAEKLHSQIHKEIKSKLPRRESERRSHPLARHMDLLAALETRLSLLAMTYIKYIEMGACCFIPGKVLDEIYAILLRIRDDATPPRPHELLTELRDISSMAMEHFEEKIVPGVKSRLMRQDTSETNTFRDQPASPVQSGFPLPLVSCGSAPNPVMHSRIPPLRMEIVQLRNSLRSTSSTVVSLRKEVSDYKGLVQDQHRKLLDQDKKISGLSRTVTEVQKSLAERDKLVLDLQAAVLRIESGAANDSTASGDEGRRISEDEDEDSRINRKNTESKRNDDCLNILRGTKKRKRNNVSSTTTSVNVASSTSAGCKKAKK